MQRCAGAVKKRAHVYAAYQKKNKAWVLLKEANEIERGGKNNRWPWSGLLRTVMQPALVATVPSRVHI